MTFSVKTYALVGAACVALVAAGLVHGTWTDRWATPVDTLRAAELLHSLPMVVGDWEGKEIEVKPGQAGVGVVGCLQRTYTHRTRNVSVVLALVCGRPGPVSTHTPEVCYGGSGYRLDEKKGVPLEGVGVPATFWASDVLKTTATEETHTRLYWAWTKGEGWVNAREGRSEFPRHLYPVLHKLYVLRDLNRPDPDPRDEACEAFLKELLPVLQQTLFGGA